MKPNFIIAIVLSIVVTLFALFNTASITVNFGFFKTTGPEALILIITFILGIIAGSMAAIPRRWKRWREVRSLKKALTVRQNSVENQRPDEPANATLSVSEK